VHGREAIAEEWLGCALRTYPGRAAGFLAEVKDPFRNPVGYTFKHALDILLEELLLGMDAERVRAALDSIVQIRAVDDVTPAQALEFLFQLKPILRRHAPDRDPDRLAVRIDEIALQAFDLYMQYRERTYAARANEARRRIFVLERKMQKEQPAACASRGAE